MMKRTILSILAAALLFSCEDATEIVQPGELLAGGAFNTVDDLTTGIFGVYSPAVTDNEIFFTARFTDESAVGLTNSGGGVALHSYNLFPNDGNVSGIWLNNYTLIFRTNVFINAAEQITPNPDDPAEQEAYDRALGEAYALRAYGHSKLLAYFGADLSDRSSLGVPVVDFVPSPSDQPARNTVGEVYDAIYADLDEAERLFIAADPSYDVFFISQPFVDALRARVAAYEGNTSLMVSSANAVLADFSLPTSANPTDYNDLWEDISIPDFGELIFKLDVTSNNDALSNIWNVNRSDLTGSPVFEMGRSVYNEYAATETSNGDIRPAIFLDPTSTIDSNYATAPNPQDSDVLVVDKYPGDATLPGLGGGLRNDIKVFRTVEMHFILAEAAVRNGDLVEAERQVRLVRNARYTTPASVITYANETEAWQDILLERQKELWGEGHRYIDIKRLGRVANQGYERDPIDCSLYAAPGCNLAPTDFRTQYLPIPLNEINGNPGITQNQGY